MSVQVSVIIVSYNVQAFLEQCIYSVFQASKHIEIEVFVIDNNSVDDSVEMIKNSFPNVNLICNNENKGFAYACNQGLRLSKGKYNLLLNPDTIIQETTLLLCENFMELTPDAGALGVRMINGKGKFLSESKRSLPTPLSSFYKMFGFSKLFPNSKIFGKYQLKYMDENEIHQVEVLSGAFMFIRKTVLDQIGLLDESFFMYGEDIDLSYRITQAKYNNYYFPKTTIIHYKGESTKKSSIKYVQIFYNAMLIFASKHYKGEKKVLFRLAIYMAIYLRASISVLKQIFAKIYLPVCDFAFTYYIYYQIIPVWENYKFSGSTTYRPYFFNYYIPVFILVWLAFISYFKSSDRFLKIFNLIQGILAGTLAILVIYSLLPENYRYSRAIILIGAVITFSVTLFNRLIISNIKNKGKGIFITYRKKALLIGNPPNQSVIQFPAKLKKIYDVCKSINLNTNNHSENKFHQLSDIISIYKIESIIFFLKDLHISNMIECILSVRDREIEFKIILPETSLIIGPQSVINLDTLSSFEVNLISNSKNILKKRILDILICLISILLFPFLIIKNKPSVIIKKFFHILNGNTTWVSYFSTKPEHIGNLPELPEGIFKTIQKDEIESFSDMEIFKYNLNYAKNYQVKNDIIIIFKALNSYFF